MPEYYISSANYDHILLPPGPTCNVFARSDGRYGQDDHTQWPQPYSRKYPFLCCILKKSDDSDHSVIWQDPVYDDFEWIIRDGMKIGLGKWLDWLIESLGKSCRWLMDEVAQRRTSDATLNAHPFLATQTIQLERALNRLRVITMGYHGAMKGLRLVQRLWLELHALMDYVQTYLPSMEGRAPPATEVAKVIGCFVHEAHVAEQLFSAGIPYWLIREVRKFNLENILALDVVVPPHYVLVLDEAQSAPRIYEGDSNDNRFLAICRHSLRQLGFDNPFLAGNSRGISPYEFSQATSVAGPSRQVTHSSHAKSTQPCKLIRQIKFTSFDLI